MPSIADGYPTILAWLVQVITVPGSNCSNKNLHIIPTLNMVSFKALTDFGVSQSASSVNIILLYPAQHNK